MNTEELMRDITLKYPMLSEDRLFPPKKRRPPPTPDLDARQEDHKKFVRLLKELIEKPKEEIKDGDIRQFVSSDLTCKGANVKQIFKQLCPQRFRQSYSPKPCKPLNFPSPRIERIEKQINERFLKMNEAKLKE